MVVCESDKRLLKVRTVIELFFFFLNKEMQNDNIETKMYKKSTTTTCKISTGAKLLYSFLHNFVRSWKATRQTDAK